MTGFRAFVQENREIIKKMIEAGKFSAEQLELILLADPTLKEG
jgi:hypothetical protein